MNQPEILYMVVPCYNEQEVLRETAEQLKNKYSALMSEGLISRESRIVFVNDGSKDQTWGIIKELQKRLPNCIRVSTLPITAAIRTLSLQVL